jgi:hypothetical protein
MMLHQTMLMALAETARRIGASSKTTIKSR